MALLSLQCVAGRQAHDYELNHLTVESQFFTGMHNLQNNLTQTVIAALNHHNITLPYLAKDFTHSAMFIKFIVY